MEHKPTWCAGCGNFSILNTAKKVIKQEIKLSVKDYVIVSGIGQAAKFPHYFGYCNFFNGLHGRALPVAAGIKMANHNLKVIVFSGDGDLLGEGGNHFLHTLRKNIGITCFLHNNQVYGLTKGQASPTADLGYVTQIQYNGVLAIPMMPLALALILGVGFIARTSSGEPKHMAKIMKEALEYNGFSLVEILQPCVTFNKKNTYKWYKENSKILDEKYNNEDFEEAMKLACSWKEGIHLGVIYKKKMLSYEQQSPALEKGVLVEQPFFLEKINNMNDQFWQKT